MESLQQRENPTEAKKLKRKFTGALLALLITFLAVASATYAWYIYNTSQHTTQESIRHLIMQDELINRISWEVLHNEQNADCKMYFYLEQPDK